MDRARQKTLGGAGSAGRGMRLRAGLLLLLAAVVLAGAGCSTVRQWSERVWPARVPAPDTTVTRDTDSAAETGELTAEQILERSPGWMNKARRSLAAGDSSAAERGMMRAILALQDVLFDVPKPARDVVLDSLVAWSRGYEAQFGAISGDLVATPEGLSTLVTGDERGADPDSLIDELAIDTFEVVLDTTIHGERRLPDIPDTLTVKVERVIEYFTTKPRGRKAMQVWLARAGEMVPRLRPILREHGLPEDLVYLAMIESGFRHDAHSWAAAVGPWQFISSTGRIFDLEIDWWYDERRDPEKATHAASRYLRQLYEHFGDWYLALAAYNCGEGRVRREIRRSDSEDFFELSRLPRQTRNYIPTFLGARRIAKDPERYGFAPVEYREPASRDTVLISEAVDMDALADALALELDTFKALNPAIRRWCTPPDRTHVPLYLPDGYADRFEQALAKVPPAKKTSWVRHRVRRGEALSTIARRYGTSMRAIMDVKENRLTNPHRIRAGQVLLIPVGPAAPRGVSYAGAATGEGEARSYTVRRGDTLSEIAERHRVGLSRLCAWNGLSRYSTIHPGQTLTIYGGRNPQARPVVTATADDADERGRPVYRVRQGDTISEIAERHGVGLSQVVAWNGLSRRSTIHPGDRLIVGEPGTAARDERSAHADASGGESRSGDGGERAAGGPSTPLAPFIASAYAAAPDETGAGDGGAQWREYRVGHGDTLWDIARAHDVSVGELRTANGLADASVIKVGQTLLVPGSAAGALVYIVRSGDTLSDIARRFGVSVRDLKTWNKIANANSIRAGDRIVIRARSGGTSG